MDDDSGGSFIRWTALLVYLAVWTLVPRFFLGGELWYVGVVWGTVYVLAHVYEMKVRGNCYLSADSTGAPAVFVAALGLGILLTSLDITSVLANRAAYLQAFVVTFVAGHVAAIAYSAAAFGLLTLLGIVARIFGRQDSVGQVDHDTDTHPEA